MVIKKAAFVTSLERYGNYPGIGLLAISSAKYHDYNLLMLMVLFTGAMVIISSLLAQSINEAIDPRIKSGEVVC